MAGLVGWLSRFDMSDMKTLLAKRSKKLSSPIVKTLLKTVNSASPWCSVRNFPFQRFRFPPPLLLRILSFLLTVFLRVYRPHCFPSGILRSLNVASVIILATLGTTHTSRADLIGFDGFDYRGSSMNGQEGGAFWGYQNVTPAGHKVGMSDWDNAPGFGSTSISSGGLLYTGDSGVIREYSGPTVADETKGAVNTVSVAKKVYYRVTFTRGSGATWCGVSSFDFGTERLFFGLYPDGTGKFSIYDQNTYTRLALSTVDVAVGQTYTLVAKLDYAAGNVTLYVNPDVSQSEASNTPVATASYSATTWSTAVRLGSGSSGFVTWDNLAVATTWESLRSYEVTNLNADGIGSLRAIMALARTSGGRVTFDPALRGIYAITVSGRLLRFRRETPGTLELNVPISGLQPGESLTAIDFRPATGELYGLGKIPITMGSSPQVRLYTLNTTTGAATQVGSGPFSTTLGSIGRMGFDFDPRLDLIRLTNEGGDNALISPVTAVVTTQSPLVFSDGSPGTTEILQTAHSNNFLGTLTSTLFGFDNHRSGLVQIGGVGPSANPANGQVRILFPSTTGPQLTTGFDIGDDGTAVVSGFASGYTSVDYKSTLYQLDTESGTMTSLGLIGNGATAVSAIAAAPARISLTTPISISGGNAFVIDGPASAPGIILSARTSTSLVAADSSPSMAFRNFTFTGGGGNQGGAIDYSGYALAETNDLLSLDRCTLQGNSAISRGGALSITRGNLRMSHCTLSGNSSGTGGSSVIYQQHGGTFGSETWGSILISHCTITGNHTFSNSAGDSPVALYLPAAKVTIRHSIVAGNTNAASLPADFKLTSDITQPAVVAQSLIGNGTGTGVGNAINGNRVGTSAVPLAPLLAPLAHYGGPNQTAPPFPASPAIGLAAGSAATSDQRGMLLSGTPDAGAAEFRGRPDLLLWWGTDWDKDSFPFGLEFLLGRDPLSVDTTPLLAIAPLPGAGPTGVYSLQLGPSSPPAASLAYAKLRVMRSENLASFPEEVGSISPTTPGNPATSRTFTNALGFSWTGTWTGGSPSMLFTPAASLPKRFFRLEAVLLP